MTKDAATRLLNWLLRRKPEPEHEVRLRRDDDWMDVSDAACWHEERGDVD